MEGVTYFNRPFIVDAYNNLTLYIPEDGKIPTSFLVNTILNNINSNDTCVDIGAFIGYVTVAMANRARKVFAFEPVASTFDILERNTAGYENVVLVNRALGRHSGQINVYKDETFLADSRLTSVPGRDTEAVSMVTLDSYITEPVGFIKSDAQGFEGEIILGAINTLYDYRPTLCIEFAPYLQKFSTVDSMEMLKILEALGYIFFNIEQQSNRLIETKKEPFLKQYPENSGIFTDILCIHKDKR